MLNPQDMEKAKNVQLALSQFEQMHLPVKEGEIFVCQTCEKDFPCERMMMFMLVQSMAALSAMIPSGNMAGIMQRFSGKK